VIGADGTAPSGDWTDDQARALLDLVRAVSRHRERQALFDALADALAGVFHFDNLCIVLPGPGPDQISPFFMRPRIVIPSMPRATSALSSLFDSGQPVYVRDRAQVADRPGTLKILEMLGCHSYLALPLVAQARMLGALLLQSSRVRAYDDIDLRFAREATAIVAIAVDNCTAYEELARARDRLEADNRTLRGELEAVYGPGRIVAESPGMRGVMRLVDMVAATDATVLVTGESGTGKELIARAVHEKSARAGRALVKLNCAALPSGLIESELFGHEEGAFTGATRRRRGRFELAHHGTLFLDEIGELPAEAQAKLLRVLQHRELERVGGSETIKVDVRIIAATNRDLAALAADGRFRPDLYYRLAVFPIHIPPLRERREDIAPLARAFARDSARRLGRLPPGDDDALLASLTGYAWPGNVRELQNAIERATILAGGGALDPIDLIGPGPRPDPTATTSDGEAAALVGVLDACNWIIEGPDGAAARLGMKPSTLRSRMRRLGVERRC